MQHRNIWKFNVLNSLDNEDSINAISGIIANSGISIKFFSFSENTFSFSSPIDTTAFVQTKDNIVAGIIELDRSLSVLMTTKFFKDNSIIPCDKDKIQIGNNIYYMASIKFYTGDGKSETTIEESILVSFDALKRSGFTRNKLTQ